MLPLAAAWWQHSALLCATAAWIHATEEDSARPPFTLLQLTSRGAASGGSCVLLRNRLGWDDALDVWGVHGMGGLLGSILIGPLADASVGALARSGPLLGKQVGYLSVDLSVCLSTYLFIYLCLFIHPSRYGLRLCHRIPDAADDNRIFISSRGCGNGDGCRSGGGIIV